MTGVRVGGIDLSLSSTGVAVAQVDEQGARWRTFRIRTTSEGAGLAAQHHRMKDAVARITAPLLTDERGPVDLAVIESRWSGGLRQRGAHDLSGLWWRVVSDLLDAGVPVGSVAPSTLKVYILGTAGSPKAPVTKKALHEAVARNYPGALTAGSHDVAEAVALAAMGARWLGHPADCVPDQHIRAMASALWPDSSAADPRAAQLMMKGA